MIYYTKPSLSAHYIDEETMEYGKHKVTVQVISIKRLCITGNDKTETQDHKLKPGKYKLTS